MRGERARRERAGLTRALVLSLALHAGAAAASGGSQLGAGQPPSFEVGGTFIALSIRGAPGGGPAGAPAPAARGEPDPGPVEPSTADPAPVAPPPPVDATLEAGLVATEMVASALDAAAPAVEALSNGITRRVAALVEVSIESAARHAARTPETLAAWSSSSGAAGARGTSDASGDANGSERGQGGAGADSGRGEGGGLSGPGIGSGNVLPAYPADELLAGHEGTVFVRAVCSASGAVESVSLERSSGYPALDEAALEAVKGWTFQPQLDEHGVAVASEIVSPVRFRIAR